MVAATERVQLRPEENFVAPTAGAPVVGVGVDASLLATRAYNKELRDSMMCLRFEQYIFL